MIAKFKFPMLLLPLVVFAIPAFAQTYSLSPQQEALLNQLPPAQRQQALNAIRQLESQQEKTQTSINEPINQLRTETPATGPDDRFFASAEPVAQRRSRLVIDFTPLDTMTAAERQELNDDAVLQKLEGSHLFVLNDSGVLSLAGLEKIPLLGLSETDINRRLSAEPSLSIFDINARILGQEPIGIEALKPFGYDIFDARDSRFDAPGSGPVPPDYILGPGDSVRVQLFGNVNGIYEHEISRDGVLNLPEIGPVTVAGISFSEFRKNVNQRVQQTLIGTQVSVTMGQLKTIRVFVLGDVKQPGSYVVGGLSTISSALYRSGGVNTIGSLRKIQLKRNGGVVSTLDAYDLLLRGDTSGDSRLRQGDVIFVPPIGVTVSIGGAVNRPAIYEVKRLTSAADLVGLAGGLRPEAFPSGSRLKRIGENGQRIVEAVDLLNPSSNDIRVRKGDTLIVPEILPELGTAVTLAGHVHRPGQYPWRPGMRLSDLIGSSEELKSGADTEYVLVRREGKRGEPIQALSASLADALQSVGSAADIGLEAGDTVNVFSMALGRQRIVAPLLEELALQSTIDRPVRRVEISGYVRAPGAYPLELGMRISDLVRAGGDLSEEAFGLEAELTRYSVSQDGGRESDVVKIDLDAIRRGSSEADLILREHDYLIINRVPGWDTTWSVTLKGEVTFPGQYRVRPGETLADIIRRAGGFTPAAFPEGAVFLREALKEREQEQINTLASRLETDLTSLSLQNTDAGSANTLSMGQALLQQLNETEAVGRLVINLKRDSLESVKAIELRDGDTLMVPKLTQVVTVLGETQQNTSHLYVSGQSRDEYIDLSGGLTRWADKKLIYVVRANGAVEPGGQSKWLGRKKSVEIRPGDTIVVPLETDRIRPLTFWGSVTQILYQGAIAVAAVQTFNN